MDNPEKNNNISLKGFWLLLVCILGITIVTTWSINFYFHDWKESAAFGDTFGALNALFAGLAFAGIIYTILLQREELQLQRKELELTREELKRSADAQEKTEQTLNKQIELSASSRRDDITLANINHWVDKITTAIENFQYGKLTGTLGVMAALEHLYKELKNGENDYKNLKVNAFRDRFDAIPHIYYSNLKNIINDINTILRYIKKKKLQYDLYEINLTLIASYIETYFSYINQISLLMNRNKENGCIPGPPYIELTLEHTNELINELKLGNRLDNVRVLNKKTD